MIFVGKRGGIVSRASQALISGCSAKRKLRFDNGHLAKGRRRRRLRKWGRNAVPMKNAIGGLQLEYSDNVWFVIQSRDWKYESAPSTAGRGRLPLSLNGIRIELPQIVRK